MRDTMSSVHVVPSGTAEKLPVFGVEVEVLLDGGRSAGAAAVYRVSAAPGQGAPPHRHPGQDEMFHVLDGEFELMIDGVSRRLGPGDFAYAPRGAAHAFTCVGPQPARLLVSSTPAGHEAFFRDCAAALASGTFDAATGEALCQKHGIELLPVPLAPGA